MIRAKHAVRAASIVAAIAVTGTAALAASPQPPRPLANPGEWVTSNDYQASALHDGLEGVTRFLLTVGTDGRVDDCVVTVGSGSESLDEATCRLIKERARFTPATDRHRHPVEGSWNSAIHWRIPPDDQTEGDQKPQSGMFVSSMLVDKDGKISDCRIERVEGAQEKRASVGPTTKCPSSPFSSPYTDAKGNPVAKRVRFSGRIDVLDVPAPALDTEGSGSVASPQSSAATGPKH
ncbi:MAG: TonB family protein [Sphingomonadales bacterium]|nr:TonB family protein [Sphingomonadales bacterium]